MPDVAVTRSPAADYFIDRPVFAAEMLSSPNAREIREAIRAMLSIPSLREVLGLGT